jgi:REP element-mobilizing transposase RayT
LWGSKAIRVPIRIGVDLFLFSHTPLVGTFPEENQGMKRLNLEQSDWHVTLRGARRLLLFHDEADYTAFYGFLGNCCQDSRMGLMADCLMSNHFHLSLSGGSKQLTRCMQRLNRAYSGYHNERYRLSGHAFEQEYYCEPIPSAFLLQRVVRYIHLNPVRGGKAFQPETYPWSSYKRLISSAPETLGFDERRVLSSFDADLDRARVSYARFVQKDLHRRVAAPVGKTPAWEIWQEQFMWILEYLLEREADLQPLEAEEVAIYLGSRVGVPPRAMGKALGHNNGGRRVSEILRGVTNRLERSNELRMKVDDLHVL